MALYYFSCCLVRSRWATGDEAGDTEMVTGTPCAGNLVDSRLKELLPALPVIYVKAVPVQVWSHEPIILIFIWCLSSHAWHTYVKTRYSAGQVQLFQRKEHDDNATLRAFLIPICSRHGNRLLLDTFVTIPRFTRHLCIQQVSGVLRTCSWRPSRQKTPSANGPWQGLPCCYKQTIKNQAVFLCSPVHSFL